jgi:hypothetical protein
MTEITGREPGKDKFIPAISARMKAVWHGRKKNPESSGILPGGEKKVQQEYAVIAGPGLVPVI